MKLYLSLAMLILAENCCADANWCDKERNYDEEYCEIQANDIKIEELKYRLKSIINDNANKNGKFKDYYLKIYSDVDEIIKLQITLHLKRCTFEHENYLYMTNMVTRGSGESKNLSICESLYQKPAIIFLEKVIDSCLNTDSESNLPCRYEQFDFSNGQI